MVYIFYFFRNDQDVAKVKLKLKSIENKTKFIGLATGNKMYESLLPHLFFDSLGISNII